MTKNLYDTLGLNKKASEEEIKNAYRELAKENHPDKNENNSQEKMAEINEAYMILSDKEKREKYDAAGQTKETPFQTKFIGFVDQLLLKIVNSELEVKHIDLIAEFKELTGQCIHNINAQVNQKQIQLNKYEILLKRLKTKGDNTILLAIEESIRSLNGQISAMNMETDFMNKCLDILEEYDYDFDKIKEESQQRFYNLQINPQTF